MTSYNGGNSQYVTGMHIIDLLGFVWIFHTNHSRTTRFGVRDRRVIACMSQVKDKSPFVRVDRKMDSGHPRGIISCRNALIARCNLYNKTGLLESFPSIETKGVFQRGIIQQVRNFPRLLRIQKLNALDPFNSLK